MEIVKHRKFRWVLGTVVSVGFLVHSYFYFQKNESFLGDLSKSLDHLKETNFLIVSIVLICLSVLNWGIESVKWMVLSRGITSLSFFHALKDVLSSVAISNFMPKSASDVVGRIGTSQKENKWKMLGALVINNSLQLSVTVFFGLISLAVVWDEYVDHSIWILIGVVFLFAVVLIILFGLREKLMHVIERYFNRLFNSLKVIKEYPRSVLVSVTGLSLIRYFAFSFQLVYVLWVLGYDLSFFHLMIPISLIYLTKATFPSFNFLTDLGVKQYSHVYLLYFISVLPADAVLAGILIWLLNTFSPSLIGLYFIWKR